MEFKKATKEQAKLRLALFGPSGSGKTFTGLRLAGGLGGKVAVIDTERGSASKYADRFEFDVLDLPKTDIDTYCQAISLAGRAGYDVLIIDSLTHAWHELLSEVDKLATSKYRGNTWSAWSEGTPKQRRLVNALLSFPGHIVATMRTKTEWTVQDAGNGKTRPVRVGLAPEQGKGIEYEFDLLMELSPEHIANVIKDRTGKFQDRIIDKPGEELGKELADWLKEGAAPAPRPTNGNGKRGKLIARLDELRERPPTWARKSTLTRVGWIRQPKRS
ncbi:MAG: ATP-binding protein [Anaerolineae bacterium]|nr:ATP-binding protein [Anaerolineae bacterium]